MIQNGGREISKKSYNFKTRLLELACNLKFETVIKLFSKINIGDLTHNSSRKIKFPKNFFFKFLQFF